MKIVVISDTHNKHPELILSKGDILIHCGDFSNKTEQISDFINWFAEQNFKYKILIAGNHDYALDDSDYNESFRQICYTLGISYLQDSSITINGLKFYGSPFSNEYGNYPFMGNDIELQIVVWDYIPEDTNVLITHEPAYGLGDQVEYFHGANDGKVGSRTLLAALNRLPNLTHHFHGHIHEDYGIHQETPFVSANAASFNFYSNELNEPLVFEI
jgi:Icc-related predicted phosphoesterase